MNVDELYLRHIKPLPRREQQRLLARMMRDLAPEADLAPPMHSLLELEGEGAEVWRDVDAQTYVHALRDEWEPRS
ncbi:MAG: hypothetical protein ACYDAR_13605 [Thermomicrobiales bacterium]